MDKYLRMILLMLLSLGTSDINGQVASTQSENSAVLGDSIIFGKLKNGLSYYIKNLPESKNKTNLVLFVRAGVLNQDPDQLDVAHFLEHMAVKSSKHFPRGIYNEEELLKKLNMSKFDIRATYGQRYTKFTYNSPPGNREAAATGLLWFKDVVNGLNLEEDEIATERGVLKQELLRRSGDDIQKFLDRNYIRVNLFPCSQDFSNYTEYYDDFEPVKLKEFYETWYRPDRMAVAVVGNIHNLDSLKSRIEYLFSDLKNYGELKERAQECDSLYLSQRPRFAFIQVDSASQSDRVIQELYFRKTAKGGVSGIEGYKQEVKKRILIEFINKRLRERPEDYTSFYTGAVRTVSSPSVLLLTIESKKGSGKKALQEIFGALKQIQLYGILDSEFEDLVNSQLEGIKNSNKNKNSYWLKEVEQHFIHGKALTKKPIHSLRNWLSEFSKEEFNAYLRNFDFTTPDDIGIIAPEGSEDFLSKETVVRSIIDSINKEPVPQYTAPEIPKKLIPTNEVTQLKERDFTDKVVRNTGARELILHNGVKVVLKSATPSDSNQEEIILHGFSEKGAFNFPSDDYFSAINAPAFIKHSGVNRLDKFELERFLSGSSLSLPTLNLYLNNNETGIKWDANIEDFEIMLQLVFLYFSAPRVESNAFQDWKNKQTQFYRMPGIDLKQLDLNDNINGILNNLSEIPVGTERLRGIEKTDMTRGFKIYKSIFQNAQDFTFIFTGTFEVDSVIPLINKYLGNLPVDNSTKKIESKVAYRHKLTGPVHIQLRTSEVYDKKNYLYSPYFIAPKIKPSEWREKIIAEALGRVIDHEIWKLRFEKGFSLYSVKAYGIYNEIQNQLEFGAKIECVPEEYPIIREEFLTIWNNLKSGRISENLFNQTLVEMKTKYGDRGRSNLRTQLSRLYKFYRFGMPIVENQEIHLFISSLTSADIVLAAQKYLKDEYFFEFVMMK